MTIAAVTRSVARACAFALVLLAAQAASAGRPLQVLGIGLGLAPEQVAEILRSRDDIASRDEVRRSSGAITRIVAQLKDGRTIQVAFAPPAAPVSSEVALSDPAGRDAATARKAAEAQYGQPARVIRIDGGRGIVAGWQGIPGPEGAIAPLPGAAATLRLQVHPAQGSDLRLSRAPQ